MVYLRSSTLKLSYRAYRRILVMVYARFNGLWCWRICNRRGDRY